MTRRTWHSRPHPWTLHLRLVEWMEQRQVPFSSQSDGSCLSAYLALAFSSSSRPSSSCPMASHSRADGW